MTQDNRESWLNRVAAGMAPLFEALDAPLPSRVRVAIGFTSRGAKGKAIGECWDNRRSADGHFEIFIRPDLAHAPDAMPAQIAAILAHELVHAAVGIPAGHGKAFKRIALGLGLVGPMRAPPPARRSWRPSRRSWMQQAPPPCPSRHGRGVDRAQEAESPDAQMRVRDVRLYRQDRAQVAATGRRAALSDRGAWADGA